MIALPDGGWSGVANDLADRRAGVVLAPVPCALNNVPIRANVRAGIRMRYVYIRVLGAGYTSRVQARGVDTSLHKVVYSVWPCFHSTPTDINAC
jgi:hypothetical protein